MSHKSLPAACRSLFPGFVTEKLFGGELGKMDSAAKLTLSPSATQYISNFHQTSANAVVGRTRFSLRGDSCLPCVTKIITVTMHFFRNALYFPVKHSNSGHSSLKKQTN